MLGHVEVKPGDIVFADETASSFREIKNVVRVRVGGYARNARSLNVAGDDVESISDDHSGEAVARDAHARKTLVPGVCSRVVAFEGAVGGHDLVVLEFAAGDIDTALVDTPGYTAAGCGHLRAGCPHILRYVVFLSDVGVARSRDEWPAPGSVDTRLS